MSNNRRKRGSTKLEPVEKIEEVVETPKKVEKPKISFTAWFIQKIKARKVRDHHDYALFEFFKKQGLTENEDPDLYEEWFKKF